jgi:hypothetical protein
VGKTKIQSFKFILQVSLIEDRSMLRNIALIATLAFVSSTNAETITSTFDNDFSALGLRPSTHFGNLNKFDASLGTLTGAQLLITEAMRSTLTLSNISAIGTGNFTYRIALNMFYGSNLSELETILSNTISTTLDYSTPTLNLSPGQISDVFGPFTYQATDIFNLNSILSSLSGPGAFAVSCESVTAKGPNRSVGNITATSNIQAQCDAKIEYTYTPRLGGNIPSPSSLALLAIGLLGASTYRRQKT